MAENAFVAVQRRDGLGIFAMRNHFRSLILLFLSVSTSVLGLAPKAIKISSALRNLSNGGHDLVRRDRARLRSLSDRGSADEGINVPIGTSLMTNSRNFGVYVANVQVGLGNYTLLVDSGSAYTWVGADPDNPYIPSSNSIATGENVTVFYGSGNFTGFKFTDTVIIDNIVIQNQQFAVANMSSGFAGFDGILGIGPPDRTFNTTGTDPFQLVPTVTDEMLMQGIIDANITGVSLTPLTTPDFDLDGEVTFGGVDPTKFIGNLTFVPTTDIPPASTFWGIKQSVTLGDSHTVVIPPGTPGIMDTGTTLLFLATPFLDAILSSSGAVLDEATGLFRVDSMDRVQSLFYNIGGTIFEFTPNAQIFPPQFNTLIGGQEGVFYLLFADLGDEADVPSGPGMFVNGYFWLMRHYVTYDGTRKVVGVAQTENTFT